MNWLDSLRATAEKADLTPHWRAVFGAVFEVLRAAEDARDCMAEAWPDRPATRYLGTTLDTLKKQVCDHSRSVSRMHEPERGSPNMWCNDCGAKMETTT